MATDFNYITAQPVIDTAVYASGDRLGAVMTLSGCGQANAGVGAVIGALLEDDAAVTAWDIWLHLFRVTPTLVGADNAAFDLTDANAATADKVGTIQFWSSMQSIRGATGRWIPGSNSGAVLGAGPLFYKCATADTALYGVFEARSAYDAVATDDLILKLWVIRYT